LNLEQRQNLLGLFLALVWITEYGRGLAQGSLPGSGPAGAGSTFLAAAPAAEVNPAVAGEQTPPRPSADNVAAEKSPVEKVTPGKKLYSFRAEGLDLKSALALFARANNLNIVPDGDIAGTVTLDIHDLSLERMMAALLEAHDVGWIENEGLIRVRTADTRMFNVDYLRLSRKGEGKSNATLVPAPRVAVKVAVKVVGWR